MTVNELCLYKRALVSYASNEASVFSSCCAALLPQPTDVSHTTRTLLAKGGRRVEHPLVKHALVELEHVEHELVHRVTRVLQLAIQSKAVQNTNKKSSLQQRVKSSFRVENLLRWQQNALY